MLRPQDQGQGGLPALVQPWRYGEGRNRHPTGKETWTLLFADDWMVTQKALGTGKHPTSPAELYLVCGGHCGVLTWGGTSLRAGALLLGACVRRETELARNPPFTSICRAPWPGGLPGTISMAERTAPLPLPWGG